MWTILIINLAMFAGVCYLSWKKPGPALITMPFGIAIMISIIMILSDGEPDCAGILSLVILICLFPVSVFLIYKSPTVSSLERPWYKIIAGFLLSILGCILVLALFVVVFQYLSPIFFVVFLLGITQYRKAAQKAMVMDIISAIGASMRQALPLPMALTSAAYGQKPKEARILNNIAFCLTQGWPLSEAIFRGYPGCPSDVLASIRSAEKMDQLPNMIESLQANLSKKLNDSSRMNAIQPWYPVMVLTIVFSLVLGLSIFIMPTFVEVLSDISDGRATLHFALRSLLSFSSWLLGGHGINVFIVTTILLLIIVASLQISFRKREPLRPYLVSRLGDTFKWYLPVVHWFEKTFSNLQVVQSLRAGLTAGYPLNHVIENTLELDINACYRKRLKSWHQMVEAGGNVSESVRRAGLDKTLAWAFDEKANKGNTLQVLESMEGIYRSQYNYRRNVLSSALWPMTILSLGIFVGWVVYAIFMGITGILFVTLQYSIPQ